MTRGGRPKDRDGPERRCIATGESGSTAGLIRFVISPDGVATPDLAEKLPGRGIWLSSERSAIETAIKKKLFSRAARQQVTLPEDLLGLLEALQAKRTIEAVSMARKAGAAVCGAERSLEAAIAAVLLLQARDGSDAGKRKIRAKVGALAPDVEEITCLTSDELGLAFGRPRVIHAVLSSGGATDRVQRETARLQGLRRRTGEAQDTGPGHVGGAATSGGSAQGV
ncbi:MAG: RNA-binding protein [Pseudomonadota bacterium]